MIEEYDGLKVCDKAILFAVLTCCLIAVRYECNWFYNFGIGFSIGGSFWYWAVIWIQYKKCKRKADEALEEAKRTQEECKNKILKKYGHIPGWYRE